MFPFFPLFLGRQRRPLGVLWLPGRSDLVRHPGMLHQQTLRVHQGVLLPQLGQGDHRSLSRIGRQKRWILTMGRGGGPASPFWWGPNSQKEGKYVTHVALCRMFEYLCLYNYVDHVPFSYSWIFLWDNGCFVAGKIVALNDAKILQ